jgi:hypothetical protein
VGYGILPALVLTNRNIGKYGVSEKCKKAKNSCANKNSEMSDKVGKINRFLSDKAGEIYLSPK